MIARAETDKGLVLAENRPLPSPLLLRASFCLPEPVSGANGQRSLVEMYDRQVYLSHLQARALYEALGRGGLDAAWDQ
jgi:hypothetical protein